MGRIWETGNHTGYFFLIWFPFYDIMHHMGNAWVSQFIFRKMQQGPLHKEKLGEIGTHTFPIVWVLFFPIIFPSCGLLHHLGNEWVSPSVSHDIGKRSEIHRIGRAWELVPIFSRNYGYLSSIRFSSFGILYHIGNAWLFPIISKSTGKCHKIHPVSSQDVLLQ